MRIGTVLGDGAGLQAPGALAFENFSLWHMLGVTGKLKTLFAVTTSAVLLERLDTQNSVLHVTAIKAL